MDRCNRIASFPPEDWSTTPVRRAVGGKVHLEIQKGNIITHNSGQGKSIFTGSGSSKGAGGGNNNGAGNQGQKVLL